MLQVINLQIGELDIEYQGEEDFTCLKSIFLMKQLNGADIARIDSIKNIEKEIDYGVYRSSF